MSGTLVGERFATTAPAMFIEAGDAARGRLALRYPRGIFRFAAQAAGPLLTTANIDDRANPQAGYACRPAHGLAFLMAAGGKCSLPRRMLVNRRSIVSISWMASLSPKSMSWCVTDIA